MKNSLSSTEISRERGRWLRCAAAPTAGIAITLIAALIPISRRLEIVPPVHAFSKQTRQAGAVTFHDKGCEHCHGVDGAGSDRGPELFTIGKRWKADRIERQIREGGGGMPPFGDALQPDEVKDLVDYLSAKRKAPKTVKPPVAAKSPSDDSGL
jgi:mono/diheme cytochrome c family protein